MNNKGYLLLPRSLMDQEWYGNLSCRLLALHLLQVASYRATEHPILGDLPVGSYVTTYRELAHEIERDVKTVNRAIKRMDESGFLEVAPMAKCIVLQVVWSDFVELRDCCDATKVATNPATKGATNSITAKDSVSASCNDSASDPATKVATNPATDIATNINKDKINIINTHTKSIYNPGSNKNAPARDAHTPTHTPMSADAQFLSEWIAKNYPEIDSMERPLRQEQREHLVSFYEKEKLKQIIADFVSKGGPAKHLSAFSGIMSFIRNEFPARSEKQYTYEEMCTQMTRYGIKQSEFTMVEVGGRKMWKRLS
jgi:hypothetical protein